MNILSSYLIVFCICTVVIQIITSLLFYKSRLSKPLLFHNAILLAVLFIELALASPLPINRDFLQISLSLIFLYPVTYGYIVKKHFTLNRDPRLILLSVISAIGLALYLLLPGYGLVSIALVNAYLFIFISFSVTVAGNKTLVRISHVIYAAAQFLIFASYSTLLPVLVCYAASSALFIFIAYSYKKKINSIRDHSSNIAEQNKKLTTTVSRFKISNDQSRKILIEKDLELFQLARHVSLAELTAGIAHELSQPLTGIKLIAQNMIDDINFAEFDNLQGVSELMKICTLVDKSSTIINHIRNFSKKIVYSMVIVNLNKVLLEAIDLIKVQLKKSDIDLVFMLDDDIPSINGDKISLEQLVINIILNAKDAIIKKSENNPDHNGSINITTSHSDVFVKLIIQDNGIGIPEENIQKIWSPFYTTKKRSHGTGIGLSISNKILKDHNAAVDVKSDSSGTVFTIQFPIIQSEQKSSPPVLNNSHGQN